MKYTKNDLINIQNLLKITRRGKYELDGEESIAFAHACTWLARLYQEIKKEVEPEQAKPPIVAKELKPAIRQSTAKKASKSKK